MSTLGFMPATHPPTPTHTTATRSGVWRTRWGSALASGLGFRFECVGFSSVSVNSPIEAGSIALASGRSFAGGIACSQRR